MCFDGNRTLETRKKLDVFAFLIETYYNRIWKEDEIDLQDKCENMLFEYLYSIIPEDSLTSIRLINKFDQLANRITKRMEDKRNEGDKNE